jgi:hypothetical protein
MNDEFQNSIDRIVDQPGAPSPKTSEDRAVEAVAASVVCGLVKPETPPKSLREKLRQDADKFANSAKAASAPRTSGSRNLFERWFPWSAWGWQAVAVLTLVIAAWSWRGSPQPQGAPPPPARARAALLRAALDVKQAEFTPGSDQYPALRGDVAWSPDGQMGFLRLQGLPANDPKRSQYQLWIVDPERDEFPVDGGVFDIPSGDLEAVVEFHPRLPVGRPTMFVITTERPGGVVKSRNAKPVAVAKL